MYTTDCARTKRKTTLTEQVSFNEYTDVPTEARKAVLTLDKDSSLVAISGVIVRWEPYIVVLSAGLKTETYEILGSKCLHVAREVKPVLRKRYSYFQKDFVSNIGRIGLTTIH